MLKAILALMMVLIAVIAADIWLPGNYEAFDLTVSPGSSLRQVCGQLKDHHVTQSKWTCYALMRTLNANKYLQAGQFDISKNLSHYQVIKRILFKPSKMIDVTFIEGMTVFDLVATLSQQEQLYFSEQLKQDMLAHPSDYEGRYYPDTYRIAFGGDVAQILISSEQRMSQLLIQEWGKRDITIPIDSPEQALVVASLIEEETPHDDERPLIASVIYNRLKKKMKLQIDATVHYALNDYEPLSYKDLKTQHDYNTYYIQGLPPTPIALVQPESLKAALHPQHTDFLFYVADIKTGKHIFTRQYQDHLKAIKSIRGKS